MNKLTKLIFARAREQGLNFLNTMKGGDDPNALVENPPNYYEERDVMYPSGHKLAYGQNKKQKKLMDLRKKGLETYSNVPDPKTNTFKYTKTGNIPLEKTPDKYLNEQNILEENDPNGYRQDKIYNFEKGDILTGDFWQIPNYPDRKAQDNNGNFHDENESEIGKWYLDEWEADMPEIINVKAPKTYKDLLRITKL